VAGNIRRSAGIRQFAESEPNHKDDLYFEADGVWSIDPKRDALRMSNHTRVFHQKPTLKECVDSVRSQYHFGEGAIMWAGEAVARANADILHDSEKCDFLNEYDRGLDKAREYLEYAANFDEHEDSNQKKELNHRMNRYGLNPCGEIIFSDGLCNLADVHLNRLDPHDITSQELAFKAAAINACCLLHHEFDIERYRYSRELDPIVGVSFTGLFDFFVNLFGVDWLRWWEGGRLERYYGDSLKSNTWNVFNLNLQEFRDFDGINTGLLFTAIEQEYLALWQSVVTKTVAEYCTRHNLKVPNRCTTVQPSGSKSLLTGASPGWHPPKAQRYIRRITFAKNDPIALAAIDYGYTVIPSQSDKDEHGNLLDDAFDPRCTEWLIEIPCQIAWADLPGVEDIEIAKFSALAQFDFYMQVQQHYTTHNTSATIEFRESEIEPLANRIYEAIQDDEGYISAALLARFDEHQTFPRLPFEPIDKETYCNLLAGVMMRRVSGNFDELLAKYDNGVGDDGSSAAGCDSDKCLMP
jgi:ribonucleotide reductase class II